MIGSHNTFTYLKPCNWVYRLGTQWWRTQCKTIDEQYRFGIRMFDIRVAKYKKAWRVCHGKVNLNLDFKSIEGICTYMASNFPEAIYRIVLEKGDPKEFLEEAGYNSTTRNLCHKYPMLWRIDVKEWGDYMGSVANNNANLYDRGYKFAMVAPWTPPCHEKHGFVTTSNFYKINLKEEAKKANRELAFFSQPDVLKRFKEEKYALYFLDYCTNEY